MRHQLPILYQNRADRKRIHAILSKKNHVLAHVRSCGLDFWVRLFNVTGSFLMEKRKEMGGLLGVALSQGVFLSLESGAVSERENNL